MNSLHRHKERGAVLVFSLLILLVMTVLGISSIRTSILEERMAGNYRDREMAFQAAEVALRDGEGWLLSLDEEPDTLSPPESPSPGTHTDKVWSKSAMEAELGSHWWESDAWPSQDVGDLPESLVAEDPERVIEYVKFVKDGGSLTIGLKPPTSGMVVYRVTGRGTGGTESATAVLQSIYVKRY